METKVSNRDSNLELFRIILMLLIIAHHYVVNSGLIDIVVSKKVLEIKDFFILIYGLWGKTSINCFVLITSYYMCTSGIKIKKFGKLIGVTYFYMFAFLGVFVSTGYVAFSAKECIWELKNIVLFFSDINYGFSSCFLVFYLFIPFLNKLVRVLTEKEHFILMILCLIVYTVFPSVFMSNVTYNYVTWFIVLYIIASYIRFYPKDIFSNKRYWGEMTCLLVTLSCGSVLLMVYISRQIGRLYDYSYFFVEDCNKILAVVTSICAFMFFLNIKVKKNNFINAIATSTYGVLCIHAGSDTMRQFLWKDLLRCTDMYETKFFIVHAVVSVMTVYIVCILIDQIRIVLTKTIMKTARRIN